MTNKNKILLIRIAISILLWAIAIILQFTLEQNLANEAIYASIYVIAFLVAGYDVIWGAVRNILNGNLLDELFLMSIAAIGAFCMRFFGEAEYLEAVAIMVFFQIGEVFQGVAVEKSRGAIMSSMALRANTCFLEDGSEVAVEEVSIGSHISVRPGEMIPIDGIALDMGVINTASLTGEALDVAVMKGDTLLSGSINTNTPLRIETTKLYADSTAAKILDMVENATMRKAKSEKLITKFAHVYTPIVVGLALALAIIPPVIIGLIDGFTPQLFKDYVYAALTCLVVSCPCALVVSVPLTYFAGIGANAKRKIIVKGGSYLEDLAHCNTVVMDKTGTLTKAKFGIVDIIGDREEALKIAKGLEQSSTHPLAKAINEYEGEGYSFDIEEKPGFGVIGLKDNERYICGSKRMLEAYDISPMPIEEYGSVLYVARGSSCIGAIILEDEIKKEALDTISYLHKLGKRAIVLSGDTNATVKKVCNKLSIDEYYSGLLPEDKVKRVEEIMKSNGDEKVLFVGDGINDAPVLALANIGVSMGQIGSDAAVEASDVVILNDDLNAIPQTLQIAKKTRGIVLENIIFTIGIKVLVLLLCALSAIPFLNFKVPIGLAIFADVGVCVIAIFNAMRALRIKTIDTKN